MIEKIEDETRRRIASFLPFAIAKALESYHSFSCQSAPDEAKEFNAHHTACKVAIAHIELLIKLARWVDVPADLSAIDGQRGEDLAHMLAQAQAHLLAQNNQTHDLNVLCDTDSEKA